MLSLGVVTSRDIQEGQPRPTMLPLGKKTGEEKKNRKQQLFHTKGGIGNEEENPLPAPSRLTAVGAQGRGNRP